MALSRAKLVSISGGREPPEVTVLFNPTDYGIDRGASYAELQVPGLTTPVLQFVRGEAQTLSLELFLDRTGEGRTVEGDLAALRRFVEIDPDLHAPPVCQFQWGQVPWFEGVVTSLKEKYTLFNEHGNVQRARVTLTLKSYKSAEVQLRDLKRKSPDHTRVRVLREGERLDQLAAEAYGNPRLWQVIAEENDIDRPRFVPPGTALRIPAL
jgi:hypothetical protein